MCKTNKIVLYDESGLVKKQSVELWVGPNNQGYNDESVARYANCTHMRCVCGNIHPKGYSKCPECREAIANAKYAALPYKDWDGETPLVIFDGGEYFFDISAIYEYAEDNDIKVTDLQLIICEPNCLSPIDEDYWIDILPEDETLKCIAPEFYAKLEELNELTETITPISWSPGKYRTNLE